MRKLSALLLVLLLPAVGAVVGYAAAPVFARAHFLVQQADQVHIEQANPDAKRTLQSDAFRLHGTKAEELFAQAGAVERRFRVATPIFGAFCGLVFALLNIGLNADRRREIYEIDYGSCVACGRCFASSPIEQRRRKALLPPSQQTSQPGATP